MAIEGYASEMLYVATHGMDDPYRAALIFAAANAARKKGRDVRIALLGDAVFLTKDAIAEATLPCGRPPLKELVYEAMSLKIPIHV